MWMPTDILSNSFQNLLCQLWGSLRWSIVTAWTHLHNSTIVEFQIFLYLPPQQTKKNFFLKRQALKPLLLVALATRPEVGVGGSWIESTVRQEQEGAGRGEKSQWCKGVVMKRVWGWRYDEQGAERKKRRKDKAKKEGRWSEGKKGNRCSVNGT